MLNRKKAEDWTLENVVRFWNWFGTNRWKQNEYFSNQVGEGIVRLLNLAGNTNGCVLDYGCGPGHLLDHLLSMPSAECFGLDFSPESVMKTNNRFDGRKRWNKALHCERFPSSFETGKFDVITCVETIEHLKDSQTGPLFAELRRLVSPRGFILLTTPNDEILEQAFTFCPFCGSEFHQMQHMRSFSDASLRKILEENGFQIDFCKAINLFDLMKKHTTWKDVSMWTAYDGLRKTIKKLHFSFFTSRSVTDYFRVFSPGYSPHLCAIVRLPRK